MTAPRLFLIFLLFATPTLSAFLPVERTFIGREVFEKLVKQAKAEEWKRLPIGSRVGQVGLALQGTPYVGFTLEIDDHIEASSANFHGLDCWTFFEISLAFARMLEEDRPPHTPSDLLKFIEETRYFDGKNHGNYLDRIHYLIDWFSENDRRGHITDLTDRFPTAPIPSKTGEMSKLWKHYRYLKNNPELRKGMARHEARLNQLSPRMIPQNRTREIESQLATGDIVGIARNDGGSYCSHVGIIIKDTAGRARLLHASSDAKKVILDQPITDYLARHRKKVGILIARPK